MKLKNKLPRSEDNEKFIRTKLRGNIEDAKMKKNILASRTALKNLQRKGC